MIAAEAFSCHKRFEKHKVFKEIDFTPVAERGCISTKLEHNSSISAEEAIGYAYKLGCREKVGDFFLQLQRDIQRAFRKAGPLYFRLRHQ